MYWQYKLNKSISFTKDIEELYVRYTIMQTDKSGCNLSGKFSEYFQLEEQNMCIGDMK